MKNPSLPAETANCNAALEPLMKRPELMFSNLTVSQIEASYVEISLPPHAPVKQSNAASKTTGSPLATCAGWSPQVVCTSQRPVAIWACPPEARTTIDAAITKQYFMGLLSYTVARLIA